jgi:hypothetical protein
LYREGEIIDIKELARNDGFVNEQELVDWFCGYQNEI